MPLKIPGLSSNLPTSANVKFNGNNVYSVVRKKSGVSGSTTVWEKSGFALKAYIMDWMDRKYTGSEISKLVSLIHIKITRSNNVVFDKDIPASSFANSSPYGYTISCGILEGDIVQVRTVCKDWLALRAVFLYDSSSNVQVLFNEFVAANYLTDTTISGTINSSSLNYSGSFSLQIILGQRLYQLSSGVIQWYPPGGWGSSSARTGMNVNISKASGCLVSGQIRIRFAASQDSGYSCDTSNNGSNSNGTSSLETPSVFQWYNTTWVYYHAYCAPVDNFIDWNAVNVMHKTGKCRYGTYYDDSQGENFYASFGCMPWGCNWDGYKPGGGDQNT